MAEIRALRNDDVIRSTYMYTPLQHNEFRLMTLYPGKEATFHCTLHVHPIDNAPPYEALSYVWGDPTRSVYITLSGFSFAIHSSLASALFDLRHAEKPRTLWVDALCINFMDLEERSHQIRLMANIYKGASRVVVYLGKGDERVAYPLDSRQTLLENSELEHTSLSIRLAVRAGMNALMLLPWFGRVWILQEVYNAKSLHFYYGTRQFSSDKLRKIAGLAGVYKTTAALTILDVLPDSQRLERVTGCGFHLHDLLQLSGRFTCTDPRDHIYGLLGMVDKSINTSVIKPDYSKTSQEVMKDVLAYLLFCDLESIPGPQYSDINEFLARLAPIDPTIVEHVFEFSSNLDIERLLRFGSHYITVEARTVAAARRNKTNGTQLAALLLKQIMQERAASPTPSEAPSVFSDVSASDSNSSYSSKEVAISVLHITNILLSQLRFDQLCRSGFQDQGGEPGRFANNLRRMLKSFAKQLLQSEKSQQASIVTQLILNNGGSRRIAARIRMNLIPATSNST